MQICTLLQTDNHASTPPLSFLQARCPSYRPTNSVKAVKETDGRAMQWDIIAIKNTGSTVSNTCRVMLFYTDRWWTFLSRFEMLIFQRFLFSLQGFLHLWLRLISNICDMWQRALTTFRNSSACNLTLVSEELSTYLHLWTSSRYNSTQFLISFCFDANCYILSLSLLLFYWV